MHWQGGFLFSPLEELIFSPQLRSRGRGSSSVPSGEGLTFSHSGWGQGFCDLMQYNFPISSSWQDGDCAGVTTSCAQDCSHTSQQAASGRLCRGSSSRPLPATRPGQARPGLLLTPLPLREEHIPCSSEEEHRGSVLSPAGAKRQESARQRSWQLVFQLLPEASSVQRTEDPKPWAIRALPTPPFTFVP